MFYSKRKFIFIFTGHFSVYIKTINILLNNNFLLLDTFTSDIQHREKKSEFHLSRSFECSNSASAYKCEKKKLSMYQ